MSHTPGPFTIHVNGYELDIEARIKSENEVIATVHHLGIDREPEQIGNAQLFASSPEMLALLRGYLTTYPLDVYAETTAALIAKAEGKGR